VDYANLERAYATSKEAYAPVHSTNDNKEETVAERQKQKEEASISEKESVSKQSLV
jgi:hypothetical protein